MCRRQLPPYSPIPIPMEEMEELDDYTSSDEEDMGCENPASQHSREMVSAGRAIRSLTNHIVSEMRCDHNAPPTSVIFEDLAHIRRHNLLVEISHLLDRLGIVDYVSLGDCSCRWQPNILLQLRRLYQSGRRYGCPIDGLWQHVTAIGHPMPRPS